MLLWHRSPRLLARGWLRVLQQPRHSMGTLVEVSHRAPAFFASESCVLVIEHVIYNVIYHTCDIPYMVYTMYGIYHFCMVYHISTAISQGIYPVISVRYITWYISYWFKLVYTGNCMLYTIHTSHDIYHGIYQWYIT